MACPHCTPLSGRGRLSTLDDTDDRASIVAFIKARARQLAPAGAALAEQFAGQILRRQDRQGDEDAVMPLHTDGARNAEPGRAVACGDTLTVPHPDAE